MSLLSTSLRERPIEETWRLLEPQLTMLGISRVADITGMDRVGIPVFQAIRPATAYPNTVFAGKGFTELESKVSACMEALESFVAEKEVFSSRALSLAEISRSDLPFHAPAEHFFPMNRVPPEKPLHWVSVQSLELDPSGRVVPGSPHWVVKEAVAMPCPQPNWLCHTNGIASGNTLEEAVLHGLLEVIERDAQSIALAAKRARVPSEKVLTSPRVADIIARISRAGLRYTLKDITSDLGVPVFYAIVWDPANESAWYFSGGTGCHPAAEIAAVRALTEALQARASMISGAREDLREDKIREQVGAETLKQVFRYWLSEAGEPAAESADFPPVSVPEALQFIARKVREKGFNIKWFPYSFDTLHFRVIRVVVPGLESFVLDKTRIGARLLAAQPALENFVQGVGK